MQKLITTIAIYGFSLGTLALIAACICYYHFVYKPKREERKKIDAEIKMKEIDLIIDKIPFDCEEN